MNSAALSFVFYVCMYIYICMYVCMYVYVWGYSEAFKYNGI